MNKINKNTIITQWLKTEYPIIMAPMFLVTNKAMMLAADASGISGCIPALNYRTIEELRENLSAIKKEAKCAVGVNLIVNKSNIHFKKQLQAVIDCQIDYVITSLGSPEETIRQCKPHGIKVFCDVVDVNYALKVQELGADALIAVNSGAGGHAGNIPATVLIPMLKAACRIPVISAGGVANAQGLLAMQILGAEGISVGSPFIATHEAEISQDYKRACVDYGAQDIVMSSKISGTPCTVINTPYVQKIGTEQNQLEKILNSNKQIKKYAKMLTYYRGMKAIEKAAFGATYKTVWCAGPSIEFTKQIKSVAQVVNQLTKDYDEVCACLKN